MAEGSKLQQWAKDVTENPASPSGMQQAAQAAAGTGPSGGDSRLGQWVQEQGLGANSGAWSTGRNLDSTANGWDTDFYNTFSTQWGKALEDGTAASYFDRKDATGVVLWDHDGRKFGDVYENGQLKGNVYEMHAGDRFAADQMIAKVQLDAKTQSKVAQDSNPARRLQEEVERVRGEWNSGFEKGISARAFQETVDETAKEWQEGAGDEALTALGAGGSAALGAGLGSVIAPGIGTLVGGGLGFTLGGIGSWLNRDALTQQAARAYEITALANDERGGMAGFTTGLEQWAGYGQKVISPFSNLTQGTIDAIAGEGGDGVSEFYATDDEGSRKVGKAGIGLDLVATVGDALVQFASPVGLTLYSAQMGTYITGEVGALAANRGAVFDMRSGGFDKIYEDDEGNRDLSGLAAGIGKIGIDVAQLGMARGLAAKTDSALTAAGKEKAFGVGGWVSSRIPQKLGGTKGVTGQQVNIGGFTYTLDDAGTAAVSRRASVSLLAPSELISHAATSHMARRAALTNPASKTVQVDDYFQAAKQLATGERAMTTTLVNAMGEAGEEALQTIFEAHSVGGRAEAGEIIESALYGGASGAGMGIGLAARGPSADDKLFSQANLGHMMQTNGEELSRAEWRALSPTERRARASMGSLEASTAQAGMEKWRDDLATNMVAGVAGEARLRDMVNTEWAKDLAKANDRTDAPFVISQIENAGEIDEKGQLKPGSVPTNAVVSSLRQLLVNHQHALKGLVAQEESLDAKILKLTDELANTPEESKAGVQAQIDQNQATLEDLEITIALSGDVYERVLEPAYNLIYGENEAGVDTTFADVERATEEVNEFLRKAHHMQFNVEGAGLDGVSPERIQRAMARATTFLYTRDPQDTAGSMQHLLPQVSARLTADNADNVLQIAHAILPSISGDYDGDKIRQLNQVIVHNDAWQNARSGAAYLGAGTAVNIPAPKQEKYIVEYMHQSLKSPNASLQGAAKLALAEIRQLLMDRYTTGKDQINDREVPKVSAIVMREALTKFEDAVTANAKNARAELFDYLAMHAGEQMNQFALAGFNNEWLWIDQVVTAKLQQFQRQYATMRPADSRTPNLDSMGVPLRTAKVKQRLRDKMATMGQTLGSFVEGDSMFRKFQKLHYSVKLAPVESARTIDNDPRSYTLTQQQEFYRALGVGVTQDEIDRLDGMDNIVSRAYLMLEKVAADFARIDSRLSRYEAMAVIGNMAVTELKYHADGNVSETGNQITFAQQVLKESVFMDRREKADILEVNPQIKAKHDQLLKLTYPAHSAPANGASLALVTILGPVQLQQLLGDDAAMLGAHRTVEQWVREHAALSITERRDEARKIKGDILYTESDVTENPPYNLTDVEEKNVSGFRALVDAMMADANSRVSLDDKGNLTGRFADRSDRESKKIRGLAGTLQKAFAKILEMPGQGRRDGETPIEIVQRVFNETPALARAVFEQFDDKMAEAMFRYDPSLDKVMVSNWVYKMFTIKDPAEFEMYLWRNLVLTEWAALGMSRKGADGREFAKLDRRIHQVMYRLNAADDGGIRMQKFRNELMQATDLDAFIKWVNTTPGHHAAEGAPIVPWFDDSADFSPSRANGGWGVVSRGSLFREATSALEKEAMGLLSSTVQELETIEDDRRITSAVRNVIKTDRGDENVDPVSEDDRETFRKLEARLEKAAEWRESLGPQAMLYQSMMAVAMFYGAAHNKGTNPANVLNIAEFDTTVDAYEFVTNYERMLASLTSVTLDGVSNSMGQIAKDSVRTMDDHGAQVTITKPTTEQFLDMLDNPVTRDAARAILYPTVRERGRDGQLIQQFVGGTSLRRFIDGTDFRDLWKADLQRPSTNQSLHYLTLIEGKARQFGGAHVVQEAANALAISRTSTAGSEMSGGQIRNLVLEAYQDIAWALQVAGEGLAHDATSGSNSMTELLNNTVMGMRKQSRAKRTSSLGSTDAEIKASITVMLTEKEEAIEAEKARLSGLKTVGARETKAMVERLRALDAELEYYTTKLETLASENYVQQVVEAYALPKKEGKPREAAKLRIGRYLLDHTEMMTRVPSARRTIQKFYEAYRSKFAELNLSDDEWDQLSAAVQGAWLDDNLSMAAPHVSVSPMPNPEDTENFDLYDESFSYLAKMVLDPEAPIVKAAAQLHAESGLVALPVDEEKAAYVLNESIANNEKLGRWTPDIARSIATAHERILSAPAGQVIGMPGNSPKRVPVVAAATARTYEIPPAELASTVVLDWADLVDESFYVPTQHGAEQVQDVIGRDMLNNRFASSVVATYVDHSGQTQQVDLLELDENLGQTFNADRRAAESGLQSIHVDRLHRSVVNLAQAESIPARDIRVQVTYFHPKMQPAVPEFYNNVFFEGVNYRTTADQYDSLLGGFWYAAGALNQTGQRQALDASKEGKAAMQIIEAATSATRDFHEKNWRTDFFGMLEAKASLILNTDLGFGPVDRDVLNSILKDLTIRHFVRIKTADGFELLDANQVISRQLDGETFDESAELWIPSDDVLRTMMGEIGDQGVRRYIPAQSAVNPLEIAVQWQGTHAATSSGQRITEVFDSIGETKDLADTRIVHRARQHEFRVNSDFDVKERSVYENKMRIFDELESRIHMARSKLSDSSRDFNPTRALAQAKGEHNDALNTENINFEYVDGVPYFGVRTTSDTVLAKAVLASHTKMLKEDGFRSGWIYQRGSKHQPHKGLLSEIVKKDEVEPAMAVAPRDLVVVVLDNYKKLEELRTDLRYFSGRGAYVALANTNGRTEWRGEATELLLTEMGYSRVAGSNHAYQPSEFSRGYANIRSREQSLGEVEAVTPRNMLTLLHTEGFDIQESSMWVDPGDEALTAIGVSLNLANTSYQAGFNVPVESFGAAQSQIEKVRRHLFGLDNEQGREFLAELATTDKMSKSEKEKARESFLTSFDRLLQRFRTHDGRVLPQQDDVLKKGDILPLIDTRGRVLLYRYGMKALERHEIDAQARKGLTKAGHAMNVAVFPSVAESTATTKEGTVKAVRPRAGFGIELLLNIPFQEYGDKIQLELNGMKYILTPRNKSKIKLPGQGPLPGLKINGISDYATLESKESFTGFVDNFRNAFAYFGVDFTGRLTEAMFPGEGGDADRRNQMVKAMRKLARNRQPISLTQAAELIDLGEFLPSIVDRLAEAQSGELSKAALRDNVDDNVKILRAAILYMMTPGAEIEHILGSGSLANDGTGIDTEARLMPPVFLRIFERAPLGSTLRTSLFDEFNRKLQNTPEAYYHLSEAWRMSATTVAPDGKTFVIPGYLQFAEAHSSGDNPVTNGMSFDEGEKQKASYHTTLQTWAATGAEASTKPGAFKDSQDLRDSLVRESGEVDGRTAWEILTSIPDKDASFYVQALRTPAEHAYMEQSRIAKAEFRHAIDKTGESFTDSKVAKITEIEAKILGLYGLNEAHRELIDFWVRQWMGKARGIVNGEEMGQLTADQVLEALDMIQWNASHGYLPTVGAMVSGFSVSDLTTLFMANERKKAFSPKLDAAAERTAPMDWDTWVAVSLGSVLQSDASFDPLWLRATDGFRHEYMNATNATAGLPVSLDELKNVELMDPEVNEKLQTLAQQVSMDPRTNEQLRDALILDTSRVSIGDLIATDRITGYGLVRSGSQDGEIGKRLKEIRAWRKKNGMPMPVDVSTRNFWKNGTTLIDTTSKTNALYRSMFNLRVGMAMFNPALWVAMGPELWVRRSLDSLANMLTGQATGGLGAGTAASVSDRMQSGFERRLAAKVEAKKEQFRDGTLPALQNELKAAETDEARQLVRAKIEKARAAHEQELEILAGSSSFTDRIGFTTRYTRADIDKLGELYTAMGQRNDFTSMIHQEMMFLAPKGMAAQRSVEKALEGFAKVGARMQDPTWGMRSRTLSRMYVDGALQHIMATPGMHTISVSNLANELMTDPLFLQKHYEEAHKAGLNAVANIRSMKRTVLSLSINGFVEPLAANEGLLANFLGNVVLKMPLAFSNYASNVATNLLGLQFANDFTAMMLDGKQKPGWVNWMQAKMQGIDPIETDGDRFDMSEVIEGIDLSRAFVRSGMTLTSWFAVAALSGSMLSLSGEDEEAKRRRKLAKNQGLGVVYDPNEMQNDMRSADAIFLDNIPFLGALYDAVDGDASGGQSPVFPHWMLKQFVSPVVGMERFFQTGDFRQIMWGFEDAIASFPLINSLYIKDSFETAATMANLADEAAAGDTAAAQAMATDWMFKSVMTMERMLFENAFINAIYTGMDEYDRDPYAQPLLDSDGNYQVDIEGQSRANDSALETQVRPVLDENGQPLLDARTGEPIYEKTDAYVKRDADGARLRSYTENRGTMALVLGLFQGKPFSSDYNRYNMPEKIRTIELNNVAKEEAEAAVMGAYLALGGAATLSEKEALQVARQMVYEQQGFYARDDQLTGMAAALMKDNAAGYGLSLLDEQGREHLTANGARGVVEGMAKGTVELDAASLRGVYITPEMRMQIQEEWIAEIVQEGLSLGLDQQKAVSRMKRLWYGDDTTSPRTPGLSQYLWNDAISYNDTGLYKQLNTTYVIGMDGRPLATGHKRDGVLGALGLDVFNGLMTSEKSASGNDLVGNTTDKVAGINTGLRAVEVLDKRSFIPTAEEIGESIVKAIEDLDLDGMAGQYQNNGSSGYSRRGYSRGGGGYSSGGGSGYFQRMYALAGGNVPYANAIQNINTSNPIIRRADTRRERVWSERGRLKSWQ